MSAPAVPNGPTFSLQAGETIAAYRRVLIDSNGKALLADMTENAIGYATERGIVNGAYGAINSVNGNPAVIGVAHSAIAVGALLYAQADGRVDDADGGSAIVVGIAGSAAAAQDDPVLIYLCD